MKSSILKLFATTWIFTSIASCTKDQLSKENLALNIQNAKPTIPKNARAQAIMIDFDVEKVYKQEGQITYEFDVEKATTYFTHSNGVKQNSEFKEDKGPNDQTETQLSFNGNETLPPEYNSYFNNQAPSPSTKPYEATSSTCTPDEPTTPSAPAKDAEEFKKVLSNNKCAFLNGEVLTGNIYTQEVTGTEVSCTKLTKIYFKKNDKDPSKIGWYRVDTKTKGRYIWTFTYTIAPITLSPVAKYTAWKAVSKDGHDGIQIPVTATIAALTAKTWKDGIKYSFKLGSIDAYGVQDSRITELKVQLLSEDGSQVFYSIDAPHEIKTNSTTGITGPVDFSFTANAGTSGDAVILPQKTVDARTLLNNDAFPGNQNGGPSGHDLQLAHMPAQTFKLPHDFPSGHYQIKISCKVKGEDGIVDQITNVKQQKIHIDPNCNAPIK